MEFDLSMRQIQVAKFQYDKASGDVTYKEECDPALGCSCAPDDTPNDNGHVIGKAENSNAALKQAKAYCLSKGFISFRLRIYDVLGNQLEECDV